MTLDLLAVGPHPDDVELFCGGLVALSVARGHRVGILDLTRGEMASRGTVEERAAEAAEAARTLGVHLRENLGLPDTGLTVHGERGDVQVRALVAVLRRLRPAVVVAPWEKDFHPDHQATSALVMRAVFMAGLVKFDDGAGGAAHAVQQVLQYPMRQETTPTFVVDVSAVHAVKMAAIRCHASQVLPRADAPATRVGSPLGLAAVEARDRHHGAYIGVEHGEAYVTREVPALLDPVDHFRRNATGRALFVPVRT